jgi:serine/threonine-protein phosphatase 4 regulatory subunit 1
MEEERSPFASEEENVGPFFEDLLYDDTLSDLERIGRYATSSIALQRLVHVKLISETAHEVG